MFNKIVIIGDSFCADRKNPITDWPLILSNKLNVPLYGAGFGGQSFWSIRRWMNDKTQHSLFDKQTLLIVCHTEYSRIPSTENLPLNKSVLRTEFQDDIKSDAEIKIKNVVGSNECESDKSSINVIKNFLLLRAQKTKDVLTDFYLSDLYVEEFYVWAYHAWIKELNNISSEFYKIVHIKGFGNTEIVLENNSVLIDFDEFDSLRELSETELINPNYYGMDSRRNHFKDINNAVLAEKLSNIIKRMSADVTGKISLNVRPEWNFEKIKFINSYDK